MKVADEIFSVRQVDAGLAAKGRIHLREKSTGDADVLDAAHVDGSEKAGEVADNSTTECEQQ